MMASSARAVSAETRQAEEVGGKTVTRRLTDAELAEYQPLFDNAKKLRALQRGEDVLVEPEVGEYHHAHAVQPLVRDDLPGGLNAVKHRHLNVHQSDVRAVLGGQCHRLPPVGGLGDHLDVVFRLEQRPDAAADSFISITLGGVIIATISAALGAVR